MQHYFDRSNTALAGVSTGMVSALALVAATNDAAAEGFEGAYAGFSLGTLSGDTPFGYATGPYELESDATFGMFFGYSKAINDNLIAGFELALQGSTPGDKLNNASSDTYGISNVLDMKFRLGTLVGDDNTGLGRVHLYGFAGLSVGEATNYWGVDYSFEGLNYGLGAEALVGNNNNISLGIEFIGRSVDAYNGSDPTASKTFNQISFRVALKF